MKNDAIRLKSGLTSVTGLVRVSPEPQPIRVSALDAPPLPDSALANAPGAKAPAAVWSIDPDWRKRLGEG